MKIPDTREEGPLEGTKSPQSHVPIIFKSPSNVSRGTFSVEVCSMYVIFQASDPFVCHIFASKEFIFILDF